MLLCPKETAHIIRQSLHVIPCPQLHITDNVVNTTYTIYGHCLTRVHFAYKVVFTENQSDGGVHI